MIAVGRNSTVTTVLFGAVLAIDGTKSGESCIRVNDCSKGVERRIGTGPWTWSRRSIGSAPLGFDPPEVSNARVSQRAGAPWRLGARLRGVHRRIRSDTTTLTADDRAVLAETERWSARIGAYAHLVVVLVIGSIVLVAFDTEHHTDPIATALLLADIAVALAGVPFAQRRQLGIWLSWAAGLLDVTVLIAVVFETVRFEAATSSPFKATLVVIWGVFLSFSLSAMRGRPILVLVQTLLFTLSLFLIATGLAVAPPSPGAPLSGSLKTFFDPGQSSIRIAVIVLAGTMLIVTTWRARINLRHAIVASRRAATLSRYIAPRVASVVADADHATLRAGRQQNVAVLFCDIRGFSTLAETMPPRELADFLNAFRRLAVAAIEEEGGIVDKFIGDEVMGLFGVPTVTSRDASRAIRAAQRLLASVKLWSLERTAEGLQPVSVGIGVHYGPVFAGVLGDDRLEFTVLGCTVNVARRLEELTKTLNYECIVSAWAIRAARSIASDDWICRGLPAQTLRGHSEPIGVFALVKS